jgi:acyl carrier protein
MPNPEEIRQEVRQFVCASLLRGDQSRYPGDESPLYVDSIDFLDLISFMETRFGIEFQSREIDRASLQTVAQMEAAIRGKLERIGTP